MTFLYSYCGCKFVQPFLGTVWHHLVIKFKMHIYFVPGSLLLVLIYPADAYERILQYIDRRRSTAESLQQKIRNKQNVPQQATG